MLIGKHSKYRLNGETPAWNMTHTFLAVSAIVLVASLASGLVSEALAFAGISALAFSAWLVTRKRTVGMASTYALRASSRHTSDAPGDEIWQQIIAALADPVLVLDETQHVIASNAGANVIFHALHGRHISQVHRDPALLSAVEHALDTFEPTSFELHMVLPVKRHLSGLATPVDLSRNKTKASLARTSSKAAAPPRPMPLLLIVLRDRTEEEQLAQMRADFVANASHELRTPLASLKGFIETLQHSAKDDARARDEFLGIMEEQAARMSRLINDLLSLSRIEMHQHVAPTAIVDLVGVIGGITQALAKIAADAGVTIECASMPAEARVRGDRDELVQLIQNLTQNAIKYGRRGGHLKISLMTKPQHYAVAVADDGIGIAPHHLPRLTERFYRVSAKDSRERGGTGLGLAIVKHIANRHRGELRIESVAGKGSTFTILLPKAPQ